MRAARTPTPVLLRSLLVLTLAPWAAGAVQEASDEEAGVEGLVAVDVAPRDWLVVERRPRGGRGIDPDPVFLRYLLWPGREAPVEGATLRDGRAWRRIETDVDGRLEEPFDYAYATIEVEEPCVLMAHALGAETFFVGGQAFLGDPEGRGGKGVPVALDAGENPVYLDGGDDGGVRISFTTPPESPVPALWAANLPEITDTWRMEALPFPVMNATTGPIDGFHLGYGYPVFDGRGTEPSVTESSGGGIRWIPPLSMWPGFAPMIPGSIDVPEGATAARMAIRVFSYADEELGEIQSAQVVRMPVTEPGRSPSPWSAECVSRRPEGPGRAPTSMVEVFHARSLVMVQPTHGTPEENEASLARARFDQQRVWYATGCISQIITDDQAIQIADDLDRLNDWYRFRWHHLILYGNEDTNSLWPRLASQELGVRVRRGRVDHEGRSFGGDDLCGFATTQVESPSGDALVAFLGSTGPSASRLGARFPILDAHWPKAAAGVFAGRLLAQDGEEAISALPAPSAPVEGDWLVDRVDRRATVSRSENGREVVLDNGLVRRAFRIAPDAATVAYDNLMTGAAILRGVKPEASVTLDGTEYPIGGLLGQEEYAYLLPEWLDDMTADPTAFRCTGFEVAATEAPFEWDRKRWSEERPWPPPGAGLRLLFEAPPGEHAGVRVTVHYELYDGIPVLAKWFTLENGSDKTIRLDTFVADTLAAVEYETDVEPRARFEPPNLHVETDFSCGGFSPASANKTVRWVPDPQYSSQVNYARQLPNLLVVAPPLGPGLDLAPGETFESFRTFHLVQDSTERERRGLALRRAYRTLAPWVTENPILMHVRSAATDAVKLAIDQCAEVGFEMVIMTFGSGFQIETEDPAEVLRIKGLVDYAHSKGVELGGYSLLSSRRVSDEHDVIDPETGRPGGAKFGNAPCIGSEWGQEYFAKLEAFFEATGLDLLEHDGSYPGDVCASTTHPGHRDLQDSQWRQFERIADFYRWCRERGVYLNVPDWYFLNGSSKVGMGYRETNWSLPRERQILLGRQNIYDGTWTKTPSMGWMFVPLVEYHGGGEAATLEPLSEHLADYDRHLANNFAAGVQACYRGPRLYDTEETKAVVKYWVDFYRRHREILDSDVIHIRRADGRDLDGLLHVNPTIGERALLALWNPTDRRIARTIRVPLYYAGLEAAALVRTGDGAARRVDLDRTNTADLAVDVPPGSFAFWVFEAP